MREAVKMTEVLPEITLTDPNNRDTEPSPAFSPSVSTVPADLNAILKNASGRPSTPVSKTGGSMSILILTRGGIRHSADKI